MRNEEKLAFGHTLVEIDGKCELQDIDNKDLYELTKQI